MFYNWKVKQTKDILKVSWHFKIKYIKNNANCETLSVITPFINCANVRLETHVPTAVPEKLVNMPHILAHLENQAKIMRASNSKISMCYIRNITLI